MITVKFGGTSMGSAERIYTAADIIHERAGESTVSVIVSAVAGVSNLLQESINACTAAPAEQVPAEQVPAAFTARIRNIHGAIIAGLAEQVLAEKLPSFDSCAVAERLEPLFAEYERLLNAAAAFGECPVSIHCRIMGLGELLSAIIMEETLRARGLDIRYIDSREVIFTVGSQTEGDPDYAKTNAALSAYRDSGSRDSSAAARRRALLFPGFICTWEGGTSSGGITSGGQMGLLGRNGSDFSAAIIAAGLGAERLEIWTDVDGIYTADPRIVKDALLVDEMSYEEAMELSFFGSRVLHPKTLIPIASAGIETWSLNSLNRSARGTRIGEKVTAVSAPAVSAPAVRGISCLKNTAMISVSGSGMKGRKGTAARIFAAVSRGGISVLLITQSSSEYTISFCVQETEADRAVRILEEEFEFELREMLINPIEVRKQCAIVSIIGDGMKAKRGIAAVFFSALASRDINIIAIAQGSSERSISTVISGEDGDTAVRVAHRFFFDTDQTIELFVFGAGTVGGRLLDQIRNRQQELLAQKIDIRVIAIANSRKMVIESDGIDLSKWRESLAAAEIPSSIDSVLGYVREARPLNPILVDCTAAPWLPERYAEVFRGGMHIATPNKRANTMSWSYYRELRKTANDAHRRFLYEANVGAGLPIIDTLQNMFKSGDSLVSFSGIMSGSLSYIFGRLDEGAAFSQAVLEARERGFTEPDPREDLSGMDAARKALIIAREAGYPLELSDITVAQVFPQDFDSSGTTEEFLEKLPRLDSYFFRLMERLRGEGKVLRMAAEISAAETPAEAAAGRCSVGCIEVGQEHPLWAVRGGENAFVIKTKRYNPLPLVVRGYGAGAGVTAAGVFADILRTVSWNP